MIWIDQYGRTSVEVLAQYEVEKRERLVIRKARDDAKYLATANGRAVRYQNSRRYDQTHKGHLAHAVGDINYRRRHPEKKLAHDTLRHAVDRGELTKPDVCSINPPLNSYHEGRIEAHHPDHSRPLDVVWCCARCHARLG